MEKRLKNKFQKVIFLSLLLTTFLIWFKIRFFIANKNNFPDEIDNFTVGWLMIKGKILYKDIFVHHFPFMYFLAFFLEIFSHQFITYRIFMIGYSFIFWIVMLKIVQHQLRWTVLVTMVLNAWSLIFYGGHQFTSETLFSYSLLGSYLIFINKLLYSKNHKFSKQELLLLAWFFITVFFSSIIYFLSFIPLAISYIIKNKRSFSKTDFKQLSKYLFLPIAIIAILITSYLAVNNALKETYWSLFTFNRTSYSQRYSLGDNSLNNFLVKIFNDFGNHFYQLIKKSISLLLIYFQSLKANLALLISSGNFEIFKKNLFISHREIFNNLFTFEFLIFLFLISGLFVFIRKKKYHSALLTLFFTLSVRLRYGELFHISSYFLFSFFLIAFTLSVAIQNSLKRKTIWFIIPLLLVGLYYFKMKPEFKIRTSYNLKDEYPVLTKFIKDNTEPNDKIFQINIGSSVYYLSEREPSNRFIFYYPWVDWTPKLATEAITDLKLKNPKLVLVNYEAVENSQISYQNSYIQVLEILKHDYNQKATLNNAFSIFSRK